MKRKYYASIPLYLLTKMEDIYFNILSQLPVKSIIKCAIVCKTLYAVTKCELLWKRKLDEYPGGTTIRKNTWGDTCKLHILLFRLRKKMKIKNYDNILFYLLPLWRMFIVTFYHIYQ
jgi:hypothetical protein